MNMSTLILLHVFFRHGERTPVREYQYSNDPYINDEFLPYGPGVLTNVGKETMYDLGQLLRNDYNNYLGDQFMLKHVDAFTTDSDRTKTSLQLVLASLFPPRGNNIWHDDLNWQPIPYSYLPSKEDNILGTVIHYPEFIQAYEKNSETNETRKFLKKYEELADYMRRHTGMPLRQARDAWIILANLQVQHDFGLILPDWTATIFPKKLTDFALNEYHLQTATKELKKLVFERLFKKILNNTIAKINHTSECKIHLYSGHDCTIVHILIFFQLTYRDIPNYGSCIVIEVHKIGEEYGIKLRHRESKLMKFNYLTFFNGEQILTLDELKKLYEDIVN